MVPGVLSIVTPDRIASPLRGLTCASYPSGSAMANPVGTSARWPGASEIGSVTQARRSTPALPGVALCGSGRSLPGSRRSSTRGDSSGRGTSELDAVGCQLEARQVAQDRDGAVARDEDGARQTLHVG